MFPSGKIIGSDISGGLFVVKSTVNLVGLANQNNTIPAGFEIKQNYPNPFNPSTTIEYSISKASHVMLKIYDVVGRQVGIVADEYKQAGNYKVNFDAGRLSSGVYFYTLSGDGFKETKRMTLVR